MRSTVPALILAATLSAPATAATQPVSYDGHWSVLVITEKGDCDRAYRYAVSIANGQLHYAGDTSVNMSGTVAPDGGVQVAIRLRDKGANGSGRLTTDSGVGTWHGAGPNAKCAGRWEAEKR